VRTRPNRPPRPQTRLLRRRTEPAARRSSTAAALVAVVVALVTACGGSTAPARLDGAVADPPLLVGDQRLPDAITGDPFVFRAPPGGLLAVYFGYTQCPDLCPTTMADLKVALAELTEAEAGRVTVALVTVDPERDTPDLLTAYVTGFFGEPAGRALRTLDPEELARVERAFLASSSVTRDNGEITVAHSATTSIVDDQGTVRVQWPFGTSSRSMAHDLRILLADAGGAR
jgi:protein SCO1/2